MLLLAFLSLLAFLFGFADLEALLLGEFLQPLRADDRQRIQRLGALVLRPVDEPLRVRRVDEELESRVLVLVAPVPDLKVDRFDAHAAPDRRAAAYRRARTRARDGTSARNRSRAGGLRQGGVALELDVGVQRVIPVAHAPEVLPAVLRQGPANVDLLLVDRIVVDRILDNHHGLRRSLRRQVARCYVDQTHGVPAIARDLTRLQEATRVEDLGEVRGLPRKQVLEERDVHAVEVVARQPESHGDVRHQQRHAQVKDR